MNLETKKPTFNLETKLNRKTLTIGGQKYI